MLLNLEMIEIHGSNYNNVTKYRNASNYNNVNNIEMLITTMLLNIEMLITTIMLLNIEMLITTMLLNIEMLLTIEMLLNNYRTNDIKTHTENKSAKFGYATEQITRLYGTKFSNISKFSPLQRSQAHT